MNRPYFNFLVANLEKIFQKSNKDEEIVNDIYNELYHFRKSSASIIGILYSSNIAGLGQIMRIIDIEPLSGDVLHLDLMPRRHHPFQQVWNFRIP